MSKSRSKDVMESRKRHPEKVRLELIIHSDVKGQFEQLYDSNRLTSPEITKSALFERLVKAGLPKEQATETTLCSPVHLDKLKWLADCFAVTPAEMLERLIDARFDERPPMDKFEEIHKAHSTTKPAEMARLLYELFEGDRAAAYQEYKRYLSFLQPGWVYDTTRKGTDPLAARFGRVDNALREHDRKVKEKAGTPEEIPAH